MPKLSWRANRKTNFENAISTRSKQFYSNNFKRFEKVQVHRKPIPSKITLNKVWKNQSDFEARKNSILDCISNSSSNFARKVFFFLIQLQARINNLDIYLFEVHPVATPETLLQPCCPYVAVNCRLESTLTFSSQ